VKRLLIAFVLMACGSGGGGAASSSASSTLPGGSTSKAAVELFLSSVRAQDLQAMANVWGTQKGPAKDVVERSQLEKRELIMQCYLTHDKYSILTDVALKSDLHEVQVSLSKGALVRQTKFTTVLGPSDRWYVQTVDLEPVHDLCASPPGGT